MVQNSSSLSRLLAAVTNELHAASLPDPVFPPECCRSVRVRIALLARSGMNDSSRVPPPTRGLYAVTPDIADTADLVARVDAALGGGVRWVQYRNKNASPALRRVQAEALAKTCHRQGALLIVNDDVVLAAEIGADGVHLGADDGDLDRARAVIGRDRILGVSCYASFERAERARAIGADYLAFGAIFASPTKPAAVRAPLDLLTQARDRWGLPVAAIGGITLESAGAVIAAGADLLAVISDLFEAPEATVRDAWITARARAYQQFFAQEKKS